MLTKKKQGAFDAAVWRGPIDVTTITVRLSMMLGLGLVWVGLVAWIFAPS